MDHTLTELIGFEVSCHSFQIAPQADHRADGKGQFDMSLWLNYSITKTAYGVGMYCRILSNNFISHKFSDLVHLPCLDLQYMHSLELNYFALCITKPNLLIKSKSCTSTLMFKESENINSASNTRSFPKHQHLNWSTVSSSNYVRPLELSCESWEMPDWSSDKKALYYTDQHTLKNHLMAYACPYAQHTHCASKYSKKNRSTRKSRSHKIPNTTWKHRGFIISSQHCSIWNPWLTEITAPFTPAK